MTPIHIATKPFIKHWINLNIPSGEITRHHYIGAFLLNLLKRDTDYHQRRQVTYTDSLTLYLARWQVQAQGGWLNVSETMQFNNMMGDLIRKEVRTYIISYLCFDPRLTKAVDFAREQTGMTDYDMLTNDAIIKDYQRYRATHGGVRIYKKRENLV